jgi:hypothetical protein
MKEVFLILLKQSKWIMLKQNVRVGSVILRRDELARADPQIF